MVMPVLAGHNQRGKLLPKILRPPEEQLGEGDPTPRERSYSF